MVEYVIANATVVPVRQEPSEGAEQLTQLLFAEPCEVLDRLPRWTKIRSLIDNQEGWVDFKMVTLSDNRYLVTDIETVVVGTPMAVASPMDGGADMILTMGTRLPNYSHGTFEVLGQQYIIDPTCIRQQAIGDEAIRREEICAVAQTLLNAPYLWGGKNMMGVDCSGFTQVVYSAFGVKLLRNAREQMTQGIEVASLAEAQPGDLAFFDHADRDPKATNISHVGLLLSPTEIIHCSGCVHIDHIDEDGIHLTDGELTHHLVRIKRYL